MSNKTFAKKYGGASGIGMVVGAGGGGGGGGGV